MKVQIVELKKSKNSSSNVVEYTFSDVPVILGTVLANEFRGRVYREGTVSAEGFLDKEMADKWHDIFLSLAGHQKITGAAIPFIAADESRYALSVFATRATSVVCTSMEMQSFVLKLRAFLKSSSQLTDRMPADFLKKLCQVFSEFLDLIQVSNSDEKVDYFSLFAWRERRDEWGENYCTTFPASLGLLDYCIFNSSSVQEFSFIKEPCSKKFVMRFHVPDIINGTKFADAWREDLEHLVKMGYYPMGLLVNICERGTLDSFINRYKLIQGSSLRRSEIEGQLVINMWARYSNEVFLHLYSLDRDGHSLEDVSDELSNLL